MICVLLFCYWLIGTVVWPFHCRRAYPYCPVTGGDVMMGALACWILWPFFAASGIVIFKPLKGGD